MRASFVRMPKNIGELKVAGKGRDHKYVVDRVVELQQDEYETFARDLLQRKPFIAHNRTFMGVDNDRTWHCILVNVPGRDDGILVQSEGYDYARYAAYWQLMSGRDGRAAV